MIKFWAKTMTSDNKLIADTLFELHDDFLVENFDDYVSAICYDLDIPTPIVLIKHIKNFMMFNTCTFEIDDFVEKIYFDKLQLVNVF